MAHTGKQYKLQFRRDLANVANNRNAYPEAFRYSQNAAHGTVYFDNRNNVVPLVNLLKNSQPPMVWVSAPRSVGGRPYSMSLTITSPFEIPSGLVIFDVHYTDDGENILKWTSGRTLFGGTPNNFAGFAQPNYLDSAAWRIDSSAFGWNVLAMGWDTYNP